nr:DNA gyrase subunit A [Bacilli bacterium]
RRLQGMEQDKLLAEKATLEANIAEYNRLLSSRDNIVELMVEEISAVKEKFGDDRLTDISDDAADIDNEDLIPQKNIIIALTRNGYIKRVDDDTFSAQHRGGKGITGMKTVGGDTVKLIKHTKTHTDILFFTTVGKVYRLRGYQIPDSGRVGKGMPAQNFLHLDKEEKVVSIVPLEEYPEDQYLFFISKKGVIKRTSLKEFESIHTNGKIALRLKEGDGLFDVKRTDGQAIVSLASDNGKMVSFYETDVRVMGRSAAGVTGMRLGANDTIIGSATTVEGDRILVLTTKGYGKISYAKETDVVLEDGTTRHYNGYRLTRRGAQGVYTIKTSPKTGKLCTVKAVVGDEDLLVVTASGLVIRTPISEVKISSRNTVGVKIINVDERTKVASAAIIPHSDVDEDDDGQVYEPTEEEAVADEPVVTPDQVDEIPSDNEGEE